MRGHEEFNAVECRGLYNKRSSTRMDIVPSGFLFKANNIIYEDNAIKERGGIEQLFDAPANIVRFHRYNKLSGARYIVLCSDDKVYDSSNFNTAILTSADWDDFSGLTLYDRFYFCPHDRLTGKASSFLYVYSGTVADGARKAAGAKPSSGITVAVSGTAGTIETGNRLWYVAYETDTGHITKPNATGTLFNQNTASRKASLTNIPTGPAGTAKRHILCTKRVDPYTGRQDDYEVFFVPSGVINDNSATTLTVDFFDADLQDSADYLFDELEEIPAFLALANYAGRLCGSAPNGETGVVRASKSGFPESFSDVDGFVLVDPSDNGDVRGLLPQANNLFCFKDDRAYVTFDNGAEPANWSVGQIDAGLGSCVFGVAKVLDSEGPSEDVAVVATRAGAYPFNGGFSETPLTFNVDALWDPGTITEFRATQIIINSVNKLIYITIGGGDQYYLLVGDYKNGMSHDTIRWARYSSASGRAFKFLGIYFGTSSGKVHVLFADNASDKIWVQGPDYNFEDSTACPDSAAFATDFIMPSSYVNHFAGARFSVVTGGAGVLTTELFKNSVSLGAGPSITLSTTPILKTILFNIKAVAMRLGFSLTNSSSGKSFSLSFPISIFWKKIGSGPV